MLKTNDIVGAKVHAVEGEFGTIDDALFDARDWSVRYLVIDVGCWLNGFRVLIAPHALRTKGPDHGHAAVGLSHSEILDGIWAEKKKAAAPEPLEERLYAHCGGVGLWMGGVYPSGWGLIPPNPVGDGRAARQGGTHDALPASADAEHALHSCKAMSGGCCLTARDQPLGHVRNLLIDPEEWVVCFLDVHTTDDQPGHAALVSTTEIESFESGDGAVLTRLRADPEQGEAPR